MPTIIRVKHRRAPGAVIDRRMLEDDRLTWAARGVLGGINFVGMDLVEVSPASLCNISSCWPASG